MRQHTFTEAWNNSGTAPTLPFIANRLVEKLPPRERSNFLTHSEKVDLHTGDVLCEAEKPSQHVYFPVSGVIMHTAEQSQHFTAEKRPY